jgi:hypothetical protein
MLCHGDRSAQQGDMAKAIEWVNSLGDGIVTQKVNIADPFKK